jgi:hypothetical protein
LGTFARRSAFLVMLRTPVDRRRVLLKVSHRSAVIDPMLRPVASASTKASSSRNQRYWSSVRRFRGETANCRTHRLEPIERGKRALRVLLFRHRHSAGVYWCTSSPSYTDGAQGFAAGLTITQRAA